MSDIGISALRAKLDDHLAAYDRAGAVSAVLGAVRDGHVPIDRVYTEVLTSVLVDTGAGWQAGTTRIWQEHFISSVVRTIIESLSVDVAEADTPRSGQVALLACPSGEQHDLGLRMLADRLSLRGWDTVFLGADTPAEEIVEAARSLKADLVVLSAATHYNLILLRGFVDTVKAGLPGVRVGLGGPAFACNHAWPAEDLLVSHELGLDDEPQGSCALPEAEG